MKKIKNSNFRKIISIFIGIIFFSTTFNYTFAAPPSAALSTNTILSNGQTNPTLIIDLGGGPTFANSSFSEDINNWTLYSNTTGLTILSITRTSDTSVVVNLSGTTLMGSLQLAVQSIAILAGTPVTPVTVYVQPNEITSFDTISDLNGGTSDSATYPDGTAVQTILPATVTANSGTVTVPVTSWTDTDTYNPLVAGSYTFTAVLGAIPSGFLNTGNYTATIIVVIQAPINLIPTPNSVASGEISPTIGIQILDGAFVTDTAISELPANWTIGVGSTGLVLGTITRINDTHVNISFTGTAIEGTLSIVANAEAIGRSSPSNPAIITVPPAPDVEITSFDTISDLNGGTSDSATYPDGTAVQTILPATVTANSGTVTVPVTSWTDTDTYNPLVAGSYTFTAVLGAIPSGFLNTGNYTATVEVIISIPVVENTTTFHHSSGGYMLPKLITVTPSVINCPTGYLFDTNTGKPCTVITSIESPIITRILKYKMTGQDVKDLQTYLNAHSYNSGTPDGIFGNLTKKAVVKFQIANGLIGDGVVGKLTQEKLKSILSVIR